MAGSLEGSTAQRQAVVVFSTALFNAAKVIDRGIRICRINLHTMPCALSGLEQKAPRRPSQRVRVSKTTTARRREHRDGRGGCAHPEFAGPSWCRFCSMQSLRCIISAIEVNLLLSFWSPFGFLESMRSCLVMAPKAILSLR